jgi:ABC-type transport system involved in multi-copper enzyme maturation permease subunit
MRQTLAIVRYTALETLRARTALWAAATLLLLFAASFFLREVAIADSHRLQTTFLAAAARLACALIGSVLIISAVVREFNEKGHLLLLSLALGRGRYVLGKFFGFLLPMALLCLGAAALVGAVVGAAPAAEWGLKLMLEVAVVAAVSLFAALSMRQVLPALLLTFGFYLLARSIESIQLLAHSSLGADGTGQRLMGWAVDGLALLLPRLDLFAASASLVGPPPAGMAVPLAQAALYCALLLAAAGIDLARRDL